jgi:hypothetical protein
VQLDGIVGGAIVADGKRATRIERRTSHHGIGVENAESRHHEDVALGGTRVERPKEKAFERVRVAAVDRSDRLCLDRFPWSQRDALCTRLEIEIDSRARGRRRSGCPDLVERREKRVAVPIAVEMTAQIKEDRPLGRRVGRHQNNGPCLSVRLPNSCGVCGSSCDGRRRRIAS